MSKPGELRILPFIPPNFTYTYSPSCKISIAYWSTRRFHNAQVRAARLSAEADGHMGTIAYGGAKIADPTMKFYSGALVSFDSVELKSDAFI